MGRTLCCTIFADGWPASNAARYSARVSSKPVALRWRAVRYLARVRRVLLDRVYSRTLRHRFRSVRVWSCNRDSASINLIILGNQYNY